MHISMSCENLRKKREPGSTGHPEPPALAANPTRHSHRPAPAHRPPTHPPPTSMYTIDYTSILAKMNRYKIFGVSRAWRYIYYISTFSHM